MEEKLLTVDDKQYLDDKRYQEKIDTQIDNMRIHLACLELDTTKFILTKNTEALFSFSDIQFININLLKLDKESLFSDSEVKSKVCISPKTKSTNTLSLVDIFNEKLYYLDNIFNVNDISLYAILEKIQNKNNNKHLLELTTKNYTKKINNFFNQIISEIFPEYLILKNKKAIENNLNKKTKIKKKPL